MMVSEHESVTMGPCRLGMPIWAKIPGGKTMVLQNAGLEQQLFKQMVWEYASYF